MRVQPKTGTLVSIAAFCALLLACNGEAETSRAPGQTDAAERAADDTEGGTLSESAPLVLDLANRSVLYPIDLEIAARARAARIIEVEFAQLINPDRIRVIFEMHFRSESGDEIKLGSFSPFPPDNPGTYIVATEGVIKPGGAIIISMIPLDEVKPDQEVKVVIRDPSFRRQ